ncbi:MAG: DNA polymerase III subunit beta [Deltaproteobacteria bacterium]|jgi:DNA polymerase-3 subunit beta|nr:DNA polymerase III subunit beta [Deltaproteobacteria bacterium]MBW2519020.1 DNA polymerase III subunit beta [Deltaproteobacteria bacterium]
MHFTVEKDILLKGLSRVQAIVEKRNTIPVLSNVLIEGADGELQLTATDLEVGMRSVYPANIKKPGKITVAAKKIYEIIKELPDREISFNVKENSWIELKCGKAQFNIVGLSADEFPHFPQPDKANFLQLSSKLCKEMIEKTLFAVSHDESKYNLNGIYCCVRPETNYLRMVATDGHRLSLIDKEIESVSSDELKQGLILPRKGIMELKKLAEESDSELLIGFMDNNAVVSKQQTVIIMRLVDGEFPDYERVIPKTNEHRADIAVDPLLHALRRMIILSSEKSRGVKMTFKENQLVVSSSNPELGDAREELDVDYVGPELEVGFNARYLLDILQVQDQDQIQLFLKDHVSPGLLKPAQEDGYLAVVMPMRL